MKTAKSIIVVLFVLLTAQVASAYYCPSAGRWINRDVIQENGGVNLYMFCLNSPSIHSDGLGLWPFPDPNPYKNELPDVNPDSRVVNVKKCEIVILYGHQSRKHPWKFNFPPGQCSGGTALTCWPGLSNNQILSDNQIAGAPVNDEILWFYGDSVGNSPSSEEGSQVNLRRQNRANDTDFDKLFPLIQINAIKKAHQICKLNCCSEVKIRFYSSVRPMWPLIDENFPSQTHERIVRCNK